MFNVLAVMQQCIAKFQLEYFQSKTGNTSGISLVMHC